MPSIPTNFNDTAGLEAFAKDLGVAAGVGFVVPGLVLSLILIFVFVKLCGGKGKTRIKFVNNQRYVLLAVSAVIFLICLVTCAVAWSYNNQIHTGVQHGKGTLQGVIDTSETLMSAVNNSVATLKDTLIEDIQEKSSPVVGNISQMFVPLAGINSVIAQAGSTLGNMTDLTKIIVTNLTIVKEDLTDLGEIQSEGIINDVPTPDDIPTVDNTYTEALNNSQASLRSVVKHVNNMTDQVNNTMSAVNTTVTARLFNLTSDYDKNAQDVLSYVNGFEAKIASTNRSFADISKDILHYSEVRKSVMTAILVLPLVLSAIALAGVLMRLKLLIKVAAALCFAFMFWYFLAAGVNFIAYYTLDQVCQNQNTIVANTLSIASEDIVIPGSNVTVKVSDKVVQLLHCSNNQTLIGIFEFDFLVNDLKGKITDEIQSLIRETNTLNQTAEYQQSLASLADMENTTVNLDFLQNSSLPTVQNQLTNISTQVDNTINSPTYNSSLQAVNNITNDLLLTNGTTIHVYYDSTNITTLNCTADPYTLMTSANQSDLCAKATIAINLTIVRDRTIARSGDIYGNVTDINNRLNGFNDSLPRIYAFQNDTRGYAAAIRGYLDQTYYLAAAIIAQVHASAAQVMAVIDNGTEEIIKDTECAYLGQAYSDLSDNVCTDVRYSLKIITAMMIIGGCMLFASTVASMMTSHKLERDYIDTNKA